MTREVRIVGWGAVCVLCPEGRCDGCSKEGAGRLWSGGAAPRWPIGRPWRDPDKLEMTGYVNRERNDITKDASNTMTLTIDPDTENEAMGGTEKLWTEKGVQQQDGQLGGAK